MSEKEGKRNIAFWKSPGRITIFLCYLLIPSILISLGNFSSDFPYVRMRDYMIVVYVILGAGVILFWIFRLFRAKMYILSLVLGLILSPVFTIMYERQYVVMRRGMELESPLNYVWTQLSLILYIIPFTLLVLIALFTTFIVTMVRKSIKQAKEMDEEQDDSYFAS